MAKHLHKLGLRRCRECKSINKLDTDHFVPLPPRSAHKYCGFYYICRVCYPAYMSRFSRFKLYTLRAKLIQEAGFKCQKCGLYNTLTGFFDIDHIVQPGSKGWKRNGQWLAEVTNKKAIDPANLQVLCPNCHRIKTIENREQKNPVD